MKGHEDDPRIFADDRLHDLPAPQPRLRLILFERLGGVAAIVRIVEELAGVFLVVEKDAGDPFLPQDPGENAEVFDGRGPVAEEIRRAIHDYEREVVGHPGEGEAVERREIGGNFRVGPGRSLHEHRAGGGAQGQAVEGERFDVSEVVAHEFGSRGETGLLGIDQPRPGFCREGQDPGGEEDAEQFRKKHSRLISTVRERARRSVRGSGK